MLQAAAQLELLSASEPCCEMQYRRARALVDLSRECTAALGTRGAARCAVRSGSSSVGQGVSLNVARTYYARMRASSLRRDHRLGLAWRKTLAVLGSGPESIIVPVRADKRRLRPALWRLSFLCTLAPTAAVLYTFMRCSPSEALRSQYRPQ